MPVLYALPVRVRVGNATISDREHRKRGIMQRVSDELIDESIEWVQGGEVRDDFQLPYLADVLCDLHDLRAEHRTLVDAVEQDEYLLRKLASGEWRVKMTSGSSSGMKKLAIILLALLPQDSEKGGEEP